MQDKMTGLRMQRFSREEYEHLREISPCDNGGNPFTQVCPKCGTYNHKVLYLPWIKAYCEVPFMCACMLEHEGNYTLAQEARASRKAQDILKAAIPSKYRDCTMAAMYPGKAREVAEDFIDKWDEFYAGNLGLYIYGRMGVGKSYMAAAIANALIDKGVPVLFTDFTELVNRMETDFGNRAKVLDSLKRYKLVVIDDYGCERETGYMLEQIFSVVRRRLEDGQPLIFTSNMPWRWVEDSNNSWGRINGRIMEMCVPVLVEGEDKRKKIQGEKRQLSMEIRSER